MKIKIISLLLLVFMSTGIYWSLLASNAVQSTEKAKISVLTEGYNAEKIFVIVLSKDGNLKSEIKISDGKGEVDLDVKSVERAILLNIDPYHDIKTSSGYIPAQPVDFFVAPGDNIEINFKNEQWPLTTVKGGKYNKVYNLVREELYTYKMKERKILKDAYALPGGASKEVLDKMDLEREVLGEQQNLAMYNFIINNPKEYVAAYFLNVQKGNMPLEKLELAYNTLKPFWGKDKMLTDVADKIEASKKIVEGAVAPNFTKNDKDGKEIKLSGLRGKYVIIDFWGTWCGPCRSSHPHLVSLYNEYSAKGVEFINVASEGKNTKEARDKWLAAVKADGLVWSQILNDEAGVDIVKLFNVPGFPTKILIGKDGKILVIETGSSTRIDAKLKELIK